MAAPGRTKNPDLVGTELTRRLDEEPFRFNFFQLVRLLERLDPDGKPVGGFASPTQEVVRFGVNPSLAFPASQIQSLKRIEDEPAQMAVNFFGLTGPLGVLPHSYSELILERLRSKDPTLRDFLDLFHHRIISLFYQAWERYRFTVAYERKDNDRFSRYLLALLGLATGGLQDRQQVADESLIYYSGLLSLHPRSATSLRNILTDYFEVPVEIEQFVGAWYPLDAEYRCRLGEENGGSEQLGLGAVVGDETWDQHSRIRIVLGPLTYAQYRDFLPEGAGHRVLIALTRFFVQQEFDVEARLVLRRKEVPVCELSDPGTDSPQLGWSTWMKSAPFARDPGDTILIL